MRISASRLRACTDACLRGRRRRRATAPLGAAVLAALLPLTAAPTAQALSPAASPTTAAAATPTAAAAGVPTAAAVAHHYLTDHLGSGLAARTPAATLAAAAAPARARRIGGVPGMDVSGWQGSVDWAAARRAGARFAEVKATEGTGYVSRAFHQQYDGSAAVGMTRGAYHFALPDVSTGTAQADYFLDHGGAWSSDGRTLPPALDIEYDPYGPTCYGLRPARMVDWLHAFVDRVHERTTRYPIIYSTRDWWSQCTGDSAAFGADPLWLARYAPSPGSLPAGWSAQTIWQFAAAGRYPGDQDSFHGTADALTALAAGSSVPHSDGVSARLPARLVIDRTSTRVRVVVTTAEPQLGVTVTLRSAVTGRASAVLALLSLAPVRRFTGALFITRHDIAGLGPQQWLVTTSDAAAKASSDAVMRARSVLGFRATRHGDLVRVRGAARAYRPAAGTYRPWVGRTVLVQCWTRHRWVTLTAARTDGHGDIRVALVLASRTRLRLLDSAGTGVWGAVSGQRVR